MPFLKQNHLRAIVAIGIGWQIAIGMSSAFALPKNDNLTQMVRRIWDLDSGMPQNSPLSITQTQDGYIWFGTEEGLVRFDGLSFKVFASETHEGGFSGKNVLCLTEDLNGLLWIGFEGGIARFDGRAFEIFKPSEGGLIDGKVNALHADQQNRLWIGTDKGAQLLVDGHFLGVPGVREHRAVVTRAFAEDQNRRIYIGTYEGMCIHENQSVKCYDTQNGLSDNIVWEILVDSKGTVWVATENGLNAWDGQKFLQFGVEAGFPAAQIISLLEDKSGNLWIGTQAGGLGIFDNGTFKDQGRNLGFSWSIVDIVEDRAGNLWVGGKGEGLHQFHKGKVSTHLPLGSQVKNLVVSTFVDKKGQLWLGTTDGLAKQTGNTYEIISLELDGRKGIPLVIADAAQGGIWTGGEGVGIVRIVDGQITEVINHESNGLSVDSVRSVYEDNRGNLYVGTVSGFNQFRNGQLVKIYTLQDGLASERVSGIIPEGPGKLWLYGPGGVTYFDNGAMNANSLSTEAPKRHALFVYRENANRLWVGTVGGLALLENNKTTFIDSSKGLHNDGIFSIVEDQQNNLWMSCNDGVFYIPKQDILDVMSGKKDKVECTTFGTDDGMLSREGNGGYHTAAAKTGDGIMWFATMQGAVRVNPRDIRINKQPPDVIIEHALLQDKDIVYQDSILPAGSNRLEFHFTGISFDAPDKIEFQYMLEGFEEEWIDAGHKRSAQYTNLDPDTYSFKVKAANADGYWNEEGATFQFTIEPFFYQTWWFRLFVILTILGLVGAGIYHWSRISQKRQQELSDLAWGRTRQVLEGQVDSIKQVAIDITYVADEMQSLMSGLASSSMQISASMTQAASTIEEISQTGRNTGSQAAQIVEAAKRAEENSFMGTQSVRESTEVMQDIELDAREIAKKSEDLLGDLSQADLIADMVKTIADRSKILAINASIEAAKTGEAGSGFGIVAKRMKELAISSKEATIEIAEILSTVRNSAGQITSIAETGKQRTMSGVKTIDRSGQIVSNLSEELVDNANLARVITSSINQQLQGLAQIVQATTEIDEEMRANSEKSRQLEGAVIQMNQSISILHEMIANWQTPEFYKE